MLDPAFPPRLSRRVARTHQVVHAMSGNGVHRRRALLAVAHTFVYEHERANHKCLATLDGDGLEPLLSIETLAEYVGVPALALLEEDVADDRARSRRDRDRCHGVGLVAELGAGVVGGGAAAYLGVSLDVAGVASTTTVAAGWTAGCRWRRGSH
ncbi:hypothetical protein ACGIF2_02050 [Cellulomonas sp. P22]|uniref:hypothetical protein n=1 Tax=Cellulomonas sp. P22 TaxID=3373189 RepID=UPI003787A28A